MCLIEQTADEPVKEACGVFAVHAPGRAVAQMTFDGMYALQHRGQESAGMAVSDGESVTVVKDMGLVMTVFDERTVSALPGDLAIGHTRYSTTGRSEWRNAQPVFRSVGRSGFALGHNGNLTNTAALALQFGMLPGVIASDSDLIAAVVAGWDRGRRAKSTGEDPVRTTCSWKRLSQRCCRASRVRTRSSPSRPRRSWAPGILTGSGRSASAACLRRGRTVRPRAGSSPPRHPL